LATAVWSAGRGVVPIPITDKSGAQVGLYKESHALLIGITDYTKGWRDLPGVAKDIPEVRKSLERHGFDVSVVTNPTRETLDKAFADFIRRYGHEKDNRLLVYFAGHGHTVKLAYGEAMGYIVPADAPDPNRDPNGFLGKAMDMQQIEVYAKRMQAKHALFLFDSCFSGSFFGLTRAVPQSIGFKTAKPVRLFITSGSAGEVVSDDSVFRKLFVSALAGEGDTNGDGYVTGSELGEFLTNGVINYTRGSQHPQYGAIRDPYLDKGDFVFPLARPAAAPVAGHPAPGLPQLQAPEKNLAGERLRLEARRQRLLETNRLAALRQKIAEEKQRLERQASALKESRADPGRRVGPWIVYANGTAADTRTNLLWMTLDFYNLKKRPPAGWQEAMLWAEGNTFAGYDD